MLENLLRELSKITHLVTLLSCQFKVRDIHFLGGVNTIILCLGGQVAGYFDVSYLLLRELGPQDFHKTQDFN